MIFILLIIFKEANQVFMSYQHLENSVEVLLKCFNILVASLEIQMLLS